MSNKSDLQALNANYAALIETLKGKATGGSGGEHRDLYSWSNHERRIRYCL